MRNSKPMITRFRAALLFWLMLVCGIGLVNAQLPMTGAGKGVPSVTAIAIHFPSPNDLSTGDWAKINAPISSTTETAPDSTNTASQAVSNSAALAFLETAATIGTLAANQNYSVTEYVKPISGATWIKIGPTDNTANAVGFFFNLSGSGIVGSHSTAGTGQFVSASISSLGGGWYQCQIIFNFTSTTSIQLFDMVWSQGDGNTVSTVGQTFDFWGVGQ